MNLKFQSCLILLLGVHSVTSAETINLTGATGGNGANALTPGSNGADGASGQSLEESAENLDDADKTITLLGGAAGRGGNGASSSAGTSGSGGAGGTGGDAMATAKVTLNAPTQRASITVNGGGSGKGGNAGAGTPLIHGQGGPSGDGGKGLAIVEMIAGDLTTQQTANVNATGAGGGFGGSGVQINSAQQGGEGGFGGLGGLASAEIQMIGSLATTSQILNAAIRGGSHGNHGIGAGLPSLDPPPSHQVNAEAFFTMENPADGAALRPTISVIGGSGHGIQAQSGAFPASSARLLASRIEASGSNAIMNVSASVFGGSAPLWQMPSGIGAEFIAPETLASGSDGAAAFADGLEIIATQNGSINGTLSLTGGSGGPRIGLSTAGNGANAEPGPGILKGSSQGGNVSLTLNATGGSRGTNSQGTNGQAGAALAENGVIGDSTTGNVTITQNADGGHGGGRARSIQDHTGETTGSLTVSANATSGAEGNFPPPEQDLDPTLGSAEAFCRVVGVGSLAHANANARARSAAAAEEGSAAKAEARAFGLGRAQANATSTGGDALLDGLAHAKAHAEISQPGPSASAVASAGVQGLRDGQTAEASAFAPGSPLAPVSGMAAFCRGENLTATGQNTTIHAAVSSGGGIGLLTGTFGGFGGSHLMSSIDFNPATVFSFGSLSTNPDVTSYFASIPGEQHLITCRPVQRAGAISFSNNQVVTRTYGGSFQLNPCFASGQLLLAGLGTTNRAGALDDMTFTVRRDGEVVFQSSDPAILSNNVSVVGDLSTATLDTQFAWELKTTATSTDQIFDSYFAFSSTEGSGLDIAPSNNPVPVFSDFNLKRFTGSGATASHYQISFQLAGGFPESVIVLQTSKDLGRNDPWRALRAFALDANGALHVDDTFDMGPGSAPKGFFRICRP